jgi:hypothetical protein
MYGSMIETNIHASYIATPVQDIYPLTTGTLAVRVGSPVVVGTGTNFTSVFSAIYKGSAPQVGIDPTFIGIPGLFSSSCSQVLPVASVTDDTHLTLAANWPCASASNINANGFGWIGAPSASTNCALFGSIATTCEGPIDPSLSHEVHAMWSWLYWKTGNGKYMTWAQQSAGTDYGGSSGGPGSSLPPAGPFATGSTGNFLSSLPPCGSTPCGGYGAAIALGKDFGFSAGAGNANNAMAYLILGGSSSGVPSSQTITFAAPSSVAVGSAPFNLQATASSGLPVTFASTTTPVCTVSGAIVSLVAPGTCSITATQPGNTSFAAAAPVVQSFIVTTGSQAITFAAPASVAAGSAPFTLQATASSGLAVTFASNTSNICTVSGTTVTVIAIGVCSITASQAGNTSFAEAVPVVRSFTVSAGKAAFITTDTTTQGTWKGVYGADGEAINSDSAQYPGYSQVSFSGDALFVWNQDTADPRALQKSAGTDRIASTWFTSLNMSIDVNLVDGYTHQVALYCLDWDGEGSRAERVDVLDASSGAVLDTRSIANFQGGQYLVWNLTGHVTMRITYTSGANAVVSGLFFDPHKTP